MNTIEQEKGVRLKDINLLTTREREVLERASVGDTTRELADYFNLKFGTIEKHMKNIKDKLGATNKTVAARMLWEWELKQENPNR